MLRSFLFPEFNWKQLCSSCFYLHLTFSFIFLFVGLCPVRVSVSQNLTTMSSTDSKFWACVKIHMNNLTFLTVASFTKTVPGYHFSLRHLCLLQIAGLRFYKEVWHYGTKGGVRWNCGCEVFPCTIVFETITKKVSLASKSFLLFPSNSSVVYNFKSHSWLRQWNIHYNCITSSSHNIGFSFD